MHAAEHRHWGARTARPLATFVAMFAVLAVLAGPRLLRPSGDDHYVRMAAGWLAGRTTLDGAPPHGNDWARRSTWTLRDGRQLRGYPCVLPSCRERARTAGVDTLVTGGGARVEVPRASVVARRTDWLVSFPPGPAVALLPFVAALGPARTPDVAITAVLAALIPAWLVAWLDRRRGPQPAHLWAAAALGLASPLLLLGSHGSVWFTAQVCGALALLGFVTHAWELRAPARAGAWLGLAIACRPVLAFTAVFVAVIAGQRWWMQPAARMAVARALVRFAAPLLAIGAALAAFNLARFDHATEFGHRFLDVRWQARMQAIGLFSVTYLPRNAWAAFALLPTWTSAGPRWSIHGMSLLLASPWLAAVAHTRRVSSHGVALALAIAVVATPALLYQNSGQLQFSYRFALDWLPLAAVGLAMAGAFERRWVQVAVVGAAALQAYGAWLFARAPAALFVASHWPFPPEQ